MIFWNKICGPVIFFLASSCLIQAQTSSHIKFSNANFLYKTKSATPDSSVQFLPLHASVINAEQLNAPISADFTTSKYGFFCKEELKLEKVTKIPFRFRLGSLEQCNYLEGKR